MPTDVVMPQMGESIFEGTITKWLKKAGDAVEKDEPLFEISTDKVDAEIPSPVAGVLSAIKVPEGATVEINTVVAVVSERQGPGTRDQGLATPAGSREQGAADSAGSAASGIDVVMPQMGESIFEGTITKWLKKAGDAVEKDEPLFEISTDKVDAEIPSPVAGVLSAIKVPEGATVEINTVVAVIAAGGGAAASGADTLAPVASAKDSAPAAAKPASSDTALPAITAGDGARIRSSPLVRRIAKENNLDLGQIAGAGAGSGLGGRITKEDALRWLKEHGPGSASASAEKPGTTAAPQAPGQVIPLTKMRAIIAQRMVESVDTSPHAYSVYKVDMTRIMRPREREKSRFDQKQGVKLTYMPFIAAAAVEALRKFPVVNASLENDAIHYHANINLGIAVSLEWGLIVPVIKQAEQRSFVEIARSMNDLACARGQRSYCPRRLREARLR